MCVFTPLAQQSSADLTDTVFKNYGKFLENELKRPIDKKDFVLKFKGLEEYLIDPNMKLISYDTVRTSLRKNQKVVLIISI